MKMRRTVRNAWVEALRSGDYKQATHALTAIAEDGTVGYCCLGVLCELSIKDGRNVETRRQGGKVGRAGLVDGPDAVAVCLYDDAGSLPPQSVTGWAFGVEISAGDSDWVVVSADYHGDEDDPGPIPISLTQANDDGATFAEIADLIENDLDAADDIRDDLDES